MGCGGWQRRRGVALRREGLDLRAQVHQAPRRVPDRGQAPELEGDAEVALRRGGPDEVEPASAFVKLGVQSPGNCTASKS